MTCSAWTLGAPVTDPGGNVARSRAASPLPGASRARTSETRCQTPGCGWASGAAGASTVPYAATRPRSLRIRSTIITCSARSFSERCSAAGSPSRGAVPLIGPVVTVAPLAAQEQLGREARDPAPGREEAGAVAGLQARRGLREQVGDVAVPLGVEAQAEVGLEDLPGRDPLDALAHRRDVAGGAGGAERERRGLGGLRLGRGGEQRAEVVEPVGRTVERLEPPLPARVLAQDVVVEREVGVGQRGRARRARRERSRRARRGRSRATRTSRRRPPRRRARPAGPRARRTGRRRRRAGGAGRSRRSRPPPAQRPVSANGHGSSRSASSTRSGEREQSSGTRISHPSYQLPLRRSAAARPPAACALRRARRSAGRRPGDPRASS